MRGSESFDGKLSGNRQIVDRYNEAKGKKKKKESSQGLGGGAMGMAEQRPSEKGGESAGAREPGGHDEMKNIVDEHGGAVSHTVHKTHQGYHSVTHHEDGHVHHTDHETLGEAHTHGDEAFADHMGDMPRDDSEVAEEHGDMEEGASSSRYGGTRSVGYMS